MLIDNQVDDQGFQARPVARRGRGHASRQYPNVLLAAPAPDPPHLMLGHLDRDLGQVVHLMRAFHAHVHGGGQLRAARAAACRAVLLGLIRLRHPPQPAALGTSLLAPAPPSPAILAPPALRLVAARQHIITGRRQRRVLRMTGDGPFQPRHPAGQLNILRPQRRDLPIPRSTRNAPSSRRQRIGHKQP